MVDTPLAAGAALIRVSTAVGERVLEARAESGCTALQLQALRVARLGPTMTGVATRLGVTKSTATSVIDQLVSAGLVVRKVDLRDRRRQAVWPTEEGDELLDRFDSRVRQSVHEIVDGLSARRRKRLRELLAGIPDPTGLLPLA
ncbi:MAG: MarR family transcriptional regulator [Actinomycetota bacterium]